jgi:hypothetical protein
MGVGVYKGIAVAALACLLTGCTSTQTQIGSVTIGGPGSVKSPVAQQALGPGAVPVNVEFGQSLKVPAIYRISAEGKFSQICTVDFAQQTALLAIKVEERKSSDVIYDRLNGVQGSLSLFGLGTLNVPYSKTKVDGFTIRTALAPTAENIEDYILSNLGGTCSEEILKRAPYFVVTELAVADRAYTVSREAVAADIPLWGFGALQVSNDENVEGPRKDVTFAVRGLWVNSPS